MHRDHVQSLLSTAAAEHEVRTLLVEHPPPFGADGQDVVSTLRATYGAQEQAVTSSPRGWTTVEENPCPVPGRDWNKSGRAYSVRA